MSLSPGPKAHPEHLPGDQPVAPKEQDRGDGDGEGRGDGGQQRDGVDHACKGHAAAHQRIGKDKAQDRAAGGCAQPHHHRVEDGAPQVRGVVGIGQLGEILQAQFARDRVEEALPDDAQQRQRHEQEDEDGDADQTHRQHRVLADQPELLPAAPQTGARGAC
jgi:hypothetical protein